MSNVTIDKTGVTDELIQNLEKVAQGFEKLLVEEIDRSGLATLQGRCNDWQVVKATLESLKGYKSTMVKAAYIQPKKSTRQRIGGRIGGKRAESTLPELPFSLRDAVLMAANAFERRPFTTREMFQQLQKEHGGELIVNARLPSISATLANLYNAGVFDKSIDEQRKVKFTVKVA